MEHKVSGLEYAQPVKSARKMLLERAAGKVVLTFPVQAKWIRNLAIAGSIINVVLASIVIVMTVRVARQLGAMMGISWAQQIKFIVAAAWTFMLGALLWMVVALAQLRWHLKFGNVPKQWAFDHTSLVEIRAGLFGVRRRQWKLDEIEQSKLTPLRSLFPWWPAWEMVIRFKGRYRKLRTRVYRSNFQVMTEFAQLLEAARNQPHAGSLNHLAT